MSIDPGKEKCGIAILDHNKNILMKKIIPTRSFEEELKTCIQTFNPTVMIMGNATWSKRLKPAALELSGSIPFQTVDEKHSTERAKLRYYKANPPKGLWKLLPVTLQVPDEPYDDFAAVILAEDFLNSENSE
ncbi:MAG: pre-16S rRNA-processing nuclease YqgF [Firmicutes bacterium]|nr:pre-16S rRNA-processing nuclease YqgF [Bacillota bacterium]